MPRQRTLRGEKTGKNCGSEWTVIFYGIHIFSYAAAATTSSAQGACVRMSNYTGRFERPAFERCSYLILLLPIPKSLFPSPLPSSPSARRTMRPKFSRNYARELADNSFYLVVWHKLDFSMKPYAA